MIRVSVFRLNNTIEYDKDLKKNASHVHLISPKLDSSRKLEPQGRLYLLIENLIFIKSV